MQQTEKARSVRFWMVIGLMAAGVVLPLSAFQQGTYFIFDIREDAETADGIQGRIVVAASTFKGKEAKPDPEVAEKPATKSEFETGISGIDISGEGSVTTGIDVLDEEESTFTEESPFGEEPPTPSGFFFTY